MNAQLYAVQLRKTNNRKIHMNAQLYAVQLRKTNNRKIGIEYKLLLYSF